MIGGTTQPTAEPSWGKKHQLQGVVFGKLSLTCELSEAQSLLRSGKSTRGDNHHAELNQIRFKSLTSRITGY